MTTATPGRIVLDTDGLDRARHLADALDEAMAARVLAAEADPGLIEIGIGAVLGQLRENAQGLIDDNLGYLSLVLEGLSWITGDDAEPGPTLRAWAPDL